MLKVLPVFEQRFGDAGNPRITRRTPVADALADLIDERQFNEDSPVLMGSCPRGGNHVSGGAAAFLRFKRLPCFYECPVLGGFEVGGVDDERF